MDELIVPQIRVTRQEVPLNVVSSFDHDSANAFQLYVTKVLAFTVKWAGFLYGRVDIDTKEVFVDFIYKPPQHAALFLVLSPKHPLVVSDTGAWRRQEVTKGTVVSEDGEAVTWRRELFAYGADGETDWWVMDRFRVLGAKKGQELVLCRVKKAE